MRNQLHDSLGKNPVIAAVKCREELEEAVQSLVEIVFLLYGNICELNETVQIAKDHNKKIYVHLDLVEGIGKDQYAVKYLKEQICPDGILTTRPSLVKFCIENNIFVIQRIFMLDSLSFESAIKTVSSVRPDAVEILPGIIPSIISKIREKSKLPIITGGLVHTKQQAIECLKAGALGVSTSCRDLWNM